MSIVTLRRWIVLVLAAAACLPPLGLAGTSNSLLDISADGKLLACSNRDSGTVSIVDLAKSAKVHEIKVGSHPEGVSFLGGTHRLAVAVYGDDKIVFIDADTGETIGTTDVFDEPYGVVSDRTGKRLFVSLDYPGQIVEIDADTKQVAKSHEAGRFVRGLALSADEQRLFATEYYTGAVVAIDASSGKKLDEWPGMSNDNLARQIVLHPSRAKAYLPHIRSRVTAVHGEGSIFPYVSAVDTAPGEGKRRRRIPMDAFLGNLVTSNPWETAVSPDGKNLFVVFAGTDDLFACAREPRRQTNHERKHQQALHFAMTPLNPPLMRAAMSVRIRGKCSPPGDARYLGSHCGSNFSLYSRRPWKL